MVIKIRYHQKVKPIFLIDWLGGLEVILNRKAFINPFLKFLNTYLWKIKTFFFSLTDEKLEGIVYFMINSNVLYTIQFVHASLVCLATVEIVACDNAYYLIIHSMPMLNLENFTTICHL